MKLAKCSPQALEFAKYYDCQTCKVHTQKKYQRQVKLPNAYMFNDVVSLDCFKMEQCVVNRQPDDIWYLNMIDRATSLQKCIRIVSQTPSVVWKAFDEHWILAWFGCPKSIVTDGHGSFRDVFANNLERWSCRTYRTSSEAPWQNGHCERHGGIWKSMMRKASFHHPCITVEEWDALAVQVIVAKADLSTRDGYSPNMLAFGRRPRLLPSCLDECEEDVITSISRAHGGDRKIQYLYISYN